MQMYPIPSVPFLQQQRPVHPAWRSRSLGRGPQRSFDRRERNRFSREAVEPTCLIVTPLEPDGHLAPFGQIDRIDLTGLGQAIGPVVYQFVVRFGLPPLEL